jgi:uncharacterized membrane protein YdbT with pleckstrin-like domain
LFVGAGSTEWRQETQGRMSEETILFKGSSSPVINLGTFVLCGVILAASIVFSFVVSFWLFILGGIALIYMAVQWLIIRCRQYELTTERIRIKTGILSKRTDELELYRVEDIILIEPFTERLFGLGSIHMTTNDTSTPSLRIETIRGAARLREELRKCVEACRDRKRVRVTEME